MIPFAIIVIIFLVLAIFLTSLFIQDITLIIVNVILLWAVLVRAFFEVRHKKIIKPDFISLGITTFIFIFFGSYIQVKYVLWQVLFTVFLFIIAEIIQVIMFYSKKYKIDERFNDWLEKRKEFIPKD